MNITGLNLLDERKRLNRSSITLINDFGFEGYPTYAFIDANGKFQGATYVKPQDYILFAYYIRGITQGYSLNETYEHFRNEARSDAVSVSFKKFLTDELLMKEEEINQAMALYKPFFK